MQKISPNPRLITLMEFALGETLQRLSHDKEFDFWREWAAAWVAGDQFERSPQRCVDVSLKCPPQEIVWHTLGQLAWGAKEACYDTPTNGWLVIRYIADAMLAWGVHFPDEPILALEPPTSDMVEYTVKGIAHG
jgi:hypothetical protein